MSLSSIRTSSAAASLPGLFSNPFRSLSSGKYFTKNHEWIDYNADKNCGRVGLTDYAQRELGDVVFVDLPEVGKVIGQKETVAGIESVKAADDLTSPLSGTVLKINEELSSTPALINKSPLENGWIVDLTISKEKLSAEEKALMSETEYSEFAGQAAKEH